jgi:putative ABC transport system permease protein
MADKGIDTLIVPVGSLLIVTVIAAFAGAMAAVVPARRAARLNVLKALVME